VYVDIGWIKKQAATAEQGIMWMFVWSEKILEEKSLYHDSSRFWVYLALRLF